MAALPNPAPKAAISVPWHIVALAALPGLVVALASNSFLSERLFGVDWNQIFTVARPVVAFFSILAVCGAVFVWLWRGDVREETADVDPAFLSSAVVDQVS